MILIEVQKYAVAYLDNEGKVLARSLFAAETLKHARAIAVIEAPVETVSIGLWEVPDITFKQTIILGDEKQLVATRSLIDRLDQKVRPLKRVEQ